MEAASSVLPTTGCTLNAPIFGFESPSPFPSALTSTARWVRLAGRQTAAGAAILELIIVLRVAVSYLTREFTAAM